MRQPDKYRWCKSTITKILTQQEYCGDIINFKSYTKSYKDKNEIVNPKENWAIFKEVHEPIIDRNDSPVVRICDMSQFTSKSQCVLKKGAKVVVDEVIVKKNNNIWIKCDKYKGYIGIYSYQSDTSKV